MGCCGSSPNGGREAPKKTISEKEKRTEPPVSEKPKEEPELLQTSPIDTDRSGGRRSYLQCSVDTGIAVKTANTGTNEETDTPGSLHITPPPSLRSRDEAAEGKEWGPGWQLLSGTERDFCHALNMARSKPLYLSPGLVKASKDQSGPILQRASRYGRSTAIKEIRFTGSQGSGADAFAMLKKTKFGEDLLDAKYTVIGVHKKSEEDIDLVLAEEFSDNEDDQGFVPWDVPGGTALSAIEKQIVHEINFARAQPGSYKHFVEHMMDKIEGDTLIRQGCLRRNIPNALPRCKEAVSVLSQLQPLSKIEKIDEKCTNAAKSHNTDQVTNNIDTVTVHNEKIDEKCTNAAKSHNTDQVTNNIDTVTVHNEKTARAVVLSLLITSQLRDILLKENWIAMGVSFSNRIATISFQRKGSHDNDRGENDKKIPGTGSDLLTSLEEQVFHELNTARTDPKKYMTYISEKLQLINADNMYCEEGLPMVVLNEGRPAYEEAIRFLDKIEPLEQYTGVALGLQKAAAGHSKDCSENNIAGHTGSDGSTLQSRVEKQGEWSVTLMENISFGESTARNIVIQFIVDDGVASRGHREAIFNPNGTLVGISAASHPTYKHCCVVDFAGGFTDSAETGG
eukprot:TRINITY_DN1916_c3_g1_i1.p1 TRINITY_DN1916_c3_g1~~TRINITY_DN1916_c3_g1_i1.p1  ORF type:complete len:623 (+),score=84.12 TRINITY_DN1916_c3_g1_i1:52-1920(+)